MINKKLLFPLAAVILILFVFSIYWTGFFVTHASRSNRNYDVYTLSSLTRIPTLEKYSNELLYPMLLRSDPHYGLNIQEVNILKEINNMQGINAIFVFGSCAILLMLISFFLFLRKLGLKSKFAFLVISLLILIAPIKPSFSYAAKGILSLSDIIYLGHSSTFFSLAITFLILSFYFDCLHAKKKFFYFILIFIFSILVFSSSLLGGVFLFFLSGIISLQYYLKNRKISNFYPILIIFMALTFVSLFLSTNLIKQGVDSALLFQSSRIANKSSDPFYYSVSSFMAVISLLILGTPYLLHKKMDKKIVGIIVLLFLISFSFLIPLPLKFPMYWRFIPILMLFLGIPLALLFTETNKKILPLFLLVLLCLTLSNISFYSDRTDDLKIFQGLDDILKDNRIVVTDSTTSNLLIGYYDVQTFTIPEGHIADPNVILENRIRESFLQTASLNQIKNETNFNLILIDIYQTDEITKNLIKITPNETLVFKKGQIEIYEVK